MGSNSMTYILGLDVGTKTIGVAKICVENEITTPLLTMKRQSVKKDVARIIQFCSELSISEVVVGLPIQLDGQEGRSARLARQIGSGLEEQNKIIKNLVVSYHDERFSTVEAQQKMISAGKSSQKRKKMIDSAAACVILEHFLFSKKRK
jgi:putative holliday junction resolvase